MTNAAELLPAITSTEIVEFREFEKNLSEYKDRYEGIIYDLTVPEQTSTRDLISSPSER